MAAGSLQEQCGAGEHPVSQHPWVTTQQRRPHTPSDRQTTCLIRPRLLASGPWHIGKEAPSDNKVSLMNSCSRRAWWIFDRLLHNFKYSALGLYSTWKVGLEFIKLFSLLSADCWKTKMSVIFIQVYTFVLCRLTQPALEFGSEVCYQVVAGGLNKSECRHKEVA